MIGELARRAGTTAKTLRFYEDEGLIPEPGRTPSGYRDYSPEAVSRVSFIHDAQTAGLALRQIRQILEIRDGGRPPCEHVGELIEQRLAEVAHRIVELEQTRARLQELAQRTRQLDPSECDGYCDILQPPATPAVQSPPALDS
ncbi:heavy metal-responsive transcriptional regulator [Phytoactinopolyspora endophytica]|uniref:heavy metal-responsive transcriptional regulator n=1 Tax=Phytoactinopolyspora endophytica TaxID=1642495 RepID=UPI00101D150D|nr:heavy metal-responsive transcriptional regulator [Phytoactinopolyspora endophytica]